MELPLFLLHDSNSAFPSLSSPLVKHSDFPSDYTFFMIVVDTFLFSIPTIKVVSKASYPPFSQRFPLNIFAWELTLFQWSYIQIFGEQHSQKSVMLYLVKDANQLFFVEFFILFDISQMCCLAFKQIH